MSDPTSKPAGTPAEMLARVLDASAALLAPGSPALAALPDDELHREILLPLLPAMLGDRAIRQHWCSQVAAGFLTKLRAHLDADAPAPEWQPGDFEIHVAASYLAGADARALADTLLSEESLRDLTATLMNRLLAEVWPALPRAEAVIEVPVPVHEMPASIAATTPAAVEEPAFANVEDTADVTTPAHSFVADVPSRTWAGPRKGWFYRSRFLGARRGNPIATARRPPLIGRAAISNRRPAGGVKMTAPPVCAE